MAAWGYGMYQDDTFCEVVETFREKIDSGSSVDQCVQFVYREFDTEQDKHIVQLAVAECLWRTGSMTQETLISIKKIIDDGIDARYWNELEANRSFMLGRAATLERFYDRIRLPPTSSQLWSGQQTTSSLKKGECFWYRCKGRIYGAVVLEIQRDRDPLYLIAISNQLERIPSRISDVILIEAYTVAWFDTNGLLAPRRMHGLGVVEINKNYFNRFGLMVDGNDSITLSNWGQRVTWDHSFRSVAFPNWTLKELIG